MPFATLDLLNALVCFLATVGVVRRRDAQECAAITRWSVQRLPSPLPRERIEPALIPLLDFETVRRREAETLAIERHAQLQRSSIATFELHSIIGEDPACAPQRLETGARREPNDGRTQVDVAFNAQSKAKPCAAWKAGEVGVQRLADRGRHAMQD